MCKQKLHITLQMRYCLPHVTCWINTHSTNRHSTAARFQKPCASSFTETAAGCPCIHARGGMRRSFLEWGTGAISCLAVNRKASLIAATSDGQPYRSLMRAMASLSCSSRRIVVAIGRFFSFMPQYYHIDILPVKCYPIHAA